MNSIQASNIELAMQSSLTIEAIVCALLRHVYSGDFCRSNSMQFLLRRSCNFEIARVNRLRFQRDFTAIVAALSQEFRTCSKLDAILRRFLTKLNHKGPIGRSCHAGVKFFFCYD